jgi:hypothetical protein
MTSTAKLMGVLGVFVGMRVRLTDRLWRADGLVQDAPGTVVGITPHADEPEPDPWTRINLGFYLMYFVNLVKRVRCEARARPF